MLFEKFERVTNERINFRSLFWFETFDFEEEF